MRPVRIYPAPAPPDELDGPGGNVLRGGAEGWERFPAEGCIEASRRGSDGREIVVELAVARVSYAGKPAIMAIARDVGPRRASEQALHVSEQRYRSLVATVPDAIGEMDLEGRYRYVSPKIKDLLGYQPEEVIGRTVYDFLSEEEAVSFKALMKDLIEKKQPFSGLLNESRSADGRKVVLESSGVPIFEPGGEIKGVWICTRDVTARALAQEKIAHQASLLDRISDAVISMDSQLRILSWKQAAEKIYGWRADEVVGASSSEIFKTDF